MRFKIGDKVEVMNDNEVPVSWHTAEVLSISGHKYLVKYDSNFSTSSNRITEMVSRKFVRPCPPLVEGVDSYVAGDIVEVFCQYSWKVGAVLNILGGRKETKGNRNHRQAAALQKQYLVRLLGWSQDLVIDSSCIRMRRTWHDDKWILMGKSSQSGVDVIASKPSTSNCFQRTSFQFPRYNAKASNQPKKNPTTIQDDPGHPPKSLKRTHNYDSSVFESHNGCAQKLRSNENDVRKQPVISPPVLQKVEKDMHASFKIISHGYNEKENHVVGVGNSELHSSESDACSVGSCSITDPSKTSYNRFIPVHCQGAEVLGSDAESFYDSGTEADKEKLKVSIRELELHAYRATLEALYASGPLSWEQEAMLTNLRIMLHISNDEHMKELRHLISTKNALCAR
ncbi:hypothetical protein OROHE_009303 [Orobanche hederae]